MSQRVELYYPEAPTGTWGITVHGEVVPAVAFEDYDCTIVKTDRTLSANGRDWFYVDDLVDVSVADAFGIQVVPTFVEGIAAAAVMLRSTSFKGTDPSTFQQIAGGNVLLPDAFARMRESFGALDFLVRETGTNVDIPLKDALRNVRSNNTTVINVRQPPYNAVGDGVTNDDLPVQQAYAALVALGGGTLYFPAGNYLLSQTVISSISIQILGDGPGSSRILSTNATAVISFSGLTRCSVHAITVESTVNNAYLIAASGLNTLVLDYVQLDGPTNNEIYLNDVFKYSITRCQINAPCYTTGQIHANYVVYIGAGFISNNWFSGLGDCSIYFDGGGTSDVSISGNDFSGSFGLPTSRYIDIHNVAGTARFTAIGNTIDTPAADNPFIAITASLTCSVVEHGNVLGTSASTFADALEFAGASSGYVVSSSKRAFVSVGAGTAGAPRLGAATTVFTATGNFTVGAPVRADGVTAASPYNGAEICVHLHNSTGGAITVTLTGYHGTTTNIAANTTRVYRFRYVNSGTVFGWLQQGAIVDLT